MHFTKTFKQGEFIMKKIISALILAALLLSSILAIIPVAAAGETTEQRVNMAAGSTADQNAGIAPSFYYDYHLYKHGVDIFPVKGAHATRPYVLSAINAAQGSSTINDGSLETYKDAYKGNRKYFTVGAGFRMSVFSLDAAYLISTAQSNPLDQTLRFSLSFDLDGLKDLFRR